VATEIARTDGTLLQRLRALDCCTVSDALDRLERTGVVSGLTQHSGEARIAGKVITVQLGVGEPPPGPRRHLCSAAIEAADERTVIVIEQRTGIEAGCWGGLLTLAARSKQVVGVVAEGLVRDIDEARTAGFPIFARGLTARTARGRIVEQATGVPVTIGDIVVTQGDYVVADRSGVAFIRAAELDAVLAAAETIATRETALARALGLGVPAGQVLGGDNEHMLRS
jgi:4-hydroxy-4-methyl-2-oxoglutarate aldolase